MTDPAPRLSNDPARAATGDDLIFVYGTLRRGGAAYAKLAPLARFVDRGTVAGSLYDLGSYPGIVLGAAGRVHGDVFRIADPARALAVLDAYEGLGPEGEYDRVRAAVETSRHGRLEAWIYVYTRPISGRGRIPGGDFLARGCRRRAGE